MIYNAETVVEKARFLCESANTLDVPVIVTEQYPKAFGPTVPEIKSTLKSDNTIYEKKLFSMLTEEVESKLNNLNKDQVILCGIEAHVCVMQTALDLLDKGKEVFLVCDGISSQRSHDRAVALEALRTAGAAFGTSESIIFDMIRSAGHPQFKSISQGLKDHNLKLNEFAKNNAV